MAEAAQRTRTSSPAPPGARSTQNGEAKDVEREVAGESLWNCRPQFCLIPAGIILFFAALFVLGWNEPHSICMSELYIRLHSVHALKCDDLTSAMDVAESKDLVRISCDILGESMREWTPLDFENADQGLAGAFKVNAYKVRQEVSMYQCVEKASEEGVQTEYKYKLGWSDVPQVSEKFKTKPAAVHVADPHHEEAENCHRVGTPNPSFPKSRTATKKAEILRIGSFGSGATATAATGKEPKRMGGGFVMQRFSDRIQTVEQVQLASTKTPPTLNGKPAIVHEDGTIATCNITAPTVGCVKISFFQSTATKLTVVAHVVKATLGDVVAKPARGNQADKIIRTMPWRSTSKWMCPPMLMDLFEEGEWHEKDMLDKALLTEWMRVWGVRAICFLVTVFGVRIFMVSFLKICEDPAMGSKVVSFIKRYSGIALDVKRVQASELHGGKARVLHISVAASMLTACVVWSFAGWMRAMLFVPGLVYYLKLLPRLLHWVAEADGDEAKKDD